VVAVVSGLAEAFAADGHRLFLVGGVVRDLLLGRRSIVDDIDLTTDAHPTRIRSLLAPFATDLWTQGERFGTVGARVEGWAVEITTHRAEAYDPASRKPVVQFGQSITEDLSRRDFTINAMAISLPDRSLLDPFGGAADLAARRLRTPLSPAESFGDDPLRMLRAARFLPRFDLEPEPGLEAATTELAPRLAIVSVERVRDELERLLAVADPTRGLAFLERTGLLCWAIPSFGPADRLVRQRAIRLAAVPADPQVRRAGLLEPLGPEAAAALATLRYSNADTAQTLRLLEALPSVLARHPTNETVRKVVARVGLVDIDLLLSLATMVATFGPAEAEPGPAEPASEPGPAEPASEPGPAEPASEPGSAEPPPGNGLPFVERYRRLLAAEDLSRLGSPVTGRQIMAHLQLGPGPAVGQALERLRQHRLAAGPFPPSEAYRLLDQWRVEGLL
jgi:poly(A) polymerase